MILALAVFAFAQKPADIKPSFKRGDTHTYVSSGAFTFELGTRMHTDKAFAKLEEAVVLVRGNGGYSIRQRKTLTLSYFDKIKDVPKGTTTETRTISYLPNGELDEATSWMQVSLRTARVIEFIYPGKPVSIGETWKWTRPRHPKAGCPACEKTFTYRAREIRGKQLAHRVDFHFTELGRGAPISLDGTAWVSAKDGHMMEWSADAKNFPYLATGALLCTAKLSVVETIPDGR